MPHVTGTQTATGRALVRDSTRLIALEALAREARMHPQLVRRFVAFGLVERSGGTDAAPLFRPEDAQLLARAARLRAALGLNLAGAALASELLARIEELEDALRAGALQSRRQR